MKHLCFGALMMLTACTEKVELSVNLLTDIVPGAEFSSLELFADGESVQNTPVSRRDSFVPSARIADLVLEPKSSRVLTVVLKNLDGVATSTSSELVTTLKDETANLKILRDCRSVICASPLSCVGGDCIVSDCTVGNEPSCKADDCALATDCPAMDACATASCEQGSCLYTDSGSCGDGFYCSPEEGCLSVATMVPMDAGTDAIPDAQPDMMVDATEDVSLSCAESCGGCCTGATCNDPPSPSMCGTGGAACAACGPGADSCLNGICSCGSDPSCQNGQRCDSGNCVCDAETCPGGCCDGTGQCVVSGSVDSCGNGGELCVACGMTSDNCSSMGTCGCGAGPPCAQGQRCASGLCICDASSCPTGCCDGGGECRPGNNPLECGTNGRQCVVCQNGDCPNGRCASCASACPGCCDGERCVTGDTAAACGSAGRACQVCEVRTDRCAGGFCTCGVSPPMSCAPPNICTAGECNIP